MYIVSYGAEYATGDTINEAIKQFEFLYEQVFDPDLMHVYEAKEIEVEVEKIYKVKED